MYEILMSYVVRIAIYTLFYMISSITLDSWLACWLVGWLTGTSTFNINLWESLEAILS